MTLEEAIVSDPEILGGTPVFRGTRVPVKNLFDYLHHGDSYHAFLSDFDYISEEQIQAVLDFAKRNFTSHDTSALASAA
ncbi:uncharacterized protein (DUF433 family) [Runella defluvii]|uniref:Uncharacterized protein (DUF433 family) n=1 Tax=Runella defluvii TaxID=370973 RepID=A0A7W5ZQ52_9BACT|nr:DUF433 domain-containing protein [Runella defluvii]MBB3841013.1 uncharacterized protein (DUF433 family) [Runella defluvii]HAK76558.1 hypothetical protein [Runella sp.]HAO49805.1 hypothetical protein [Runella sp.]